MKASRFPHSLALIFGMIIIAQVATWFVPAGEYQPATKQVPLWDEPSEADRTAMSEGKREGLAEARSEALTVGLPAGTLRERDILLEDGTAIPLPENCTIQVTAVEGGADRSLPPTPTGGIDAFAIPGSAPVHVADGTTVELQGIGADGVIGEDATAVFPDGAYRIEQDGRRIDPTSYAELPQDQAPSLPWHSFLTLIPKGMEKGAEIIFFVFIVGGVIAVIRATGAIDALIAACIKAFGNNRLLLVAGMTTLFAVGSSTIGMAEEYMPFIPILVTMAMALKLDAMVAVAIVYVGAGIGYGCASLNPFTVAIAKEIAGTGLTDYWLMRWALMGGMLVVGVHHIMRYCKRISAEPSNSLVADVDYSQGYEMPENTDMTTGRTAILLLFVGAIAFFIIGIPIWDFYLVELAAIFIALAIIGGIIGRLGMNGIAAKFCEGAAELTTTALLIGFARTIEVVLTDAKVIHTIVHGISATLNSLDSPALAANGMLVVQSICNFLIPSGSGQAYVTMPIMAPVAELTNVGKETAVLAYQFGDGFTNMLVPTNALLMGMLALGKIPYQRWLRFIIPLLIKIYLVAAIVLAFAANANLGS